MIKDRVQVLNPVTKRYVKIDTKQGKILGHKKDRKPYNNVEIKTGRGKDGNYK
jgi:hypothetical protein